MPTPSRRKITHRDRERLAEYEATIPPTCLIDGCERIRVTMHFGWEYGPLCEPHMLDAWRWVEYREHLNPTVQANTQRQAEVRADIPRLVYYAQLRHGHIKIGVTSNLPQRIRNLRLDWPGAVLAAEPGGYDVERRRHRQFEAEQRVDGNGHRIEDFEPSDELLAHIARIRRQHGDPAKLDRYLITGDWEYDQPA